MYHVIDQIKLSNNVHSDDPKLNKKMKEGTSVSLRGWGLEENSFHQSSKSLSLERGPREPPCIVKFESCFKIKLLMLISLMECLY